MLVSDVVMPQMGGPELAERLAALHPGLKVLYMSGYSEYIASGQGSRDTGTAFLQKPFALEILPLKVREVLGKPAVAPSSEA